MEAEFIAVSGPMLGERFALGQKEFRIGRAPYAGLSLSQPETAWEHCVVQERDGRFQLMDCRSGFGTYVNGMRVAEHWLDEGDQVSIGDTVLVFRGGTGEAQKASQQDTLLRACSLMFLFRALAASQNAAHRSTLESQILRLTADLTGCTAGSVVLGRSAEEIAAAATERGLPAAVTEAAPRAVREGSVLDAQTRTIALPLLSGGAIAGVLAASFPPEEAANLAEHRDTLCAIGTLAAAALDTVRDVERLRAENAMLAEQLAVSDGGIVGGSAGIARLKQMIRRLAPLDTSVLILGESGSGKELVAHALHRQSPRAPKPFVAINCAALTDTLLESELFGHEKGAFTGAVAQKKGKLELAESGTVFLDEIGELAAPLQAKLLRVLQQREFERVGGTKTMKLDIRLIAATNRDLAAEARRGAFREDLYHRLNVVAVRVPPLRSRTEDIPELARTFMERSSARCRRRVSGISPEAEKALLSYTWPGNVRELENAIEHAVVLGQTEMLLPEDLPESVLESAASEAAPGALQPSVVETKRQMILDAWRQVGGDHNLAAARLNIHPNSLRRLIRNLKLREVLE